MGVRSPHEATAEASRPNNLHSRPTVCTRRCARTRHVADQIQFSRKLRTPDWDAELAFPSVRLAFCAPAHPLRHGTRPGASILLHPRPTGHSSKHLPSRHAGTVGRGFKSEVKQPGKRAHPRRTVMIATFRSLAACGAVLSTVAAADAQSIDWAKVDGIFGRTGTVGGAVHRYGFPRTDLTVTLDGVTIRPTLALGGWIALQPMGNMAVVMGDFLLLQSEVNPVMAKLLEGGLEVTAVQNHLLRAEPLTFYMHVGGHGDPVKMAETIRDALADGLSHFHRVAVSAHVHVKRQGLGAQQMILDGRNLEAAFQQLGHHGIDLALEQQEIAHDHRHVPHRLERDPAAQGKRGPDCYAVERDREISARKAVTMNRAADRPGSAENPVNLRPIDALRIRSRNRRKHGAAGRKTPKRSYHDSPPWMGSLARLLDFAFEAPPYRPGMPGR